MNRQVLVVIFVASLMAGVAMWAVVRFTAPPAATGPVTGADPVSPGGEAPAGAVRRITATLFYVSPDGLRLTPVQREVLFGETPAEQARRLIEAQLEPAPDPLISAIPPGVVLRQIFVDDAGNAYADFSAELRAAHPGGSLNEIFTAYAIVNAVTMNLPAIRAVQILIDGHEVDTLAGHVDLRMPLPRAPQWVDAQTSTPTAAPAR